MAQSWRQEVFPHSPQQARELVPLLTRHTITQLNLPNKQRGEQQALLDRCRALAAALPPHGTVCCHWSVAKCASTWLHHATCDASMRFEIDTAPVSCPTRSNYCRNPEATYEGFAAFCGGLAAIGRCSLLLVSGSQRKKLDSVAVRAASCCKVAVVGRHCICRHGGGFPAEPSTALLVLSSTRCKACPAHFMPCLPRSLPPTAGA